MPCAYSPHVRRSQRPECRGSHGLDVQGCHRSTCLTRCPGRRTRWTRATRRTRRRWQRRASLCPSRRLATRSSPSTTWRCRRAQRCRPPRRWLRRRPRRVRALGSVCGSPQTLCSCCIAGGQRRSRPPRLLAAQAPAPGAWSRVCLAALCPDLKPWLYAAVQEGCAKSGTVTTVRHKRPRLMHAQGFVCDPWSPKCVHHYLGGTATLAAQALVLHATRC